MKQSNDLWHVRFCDFPDFTRGHGGGRLRLTVTFNQGSRYDPTDPISQSDPSAESRPLEGPGEVTCSQVQYSNFGVYFE